MADHACRCHSGKPYSECCKPFHEGALARNALELMRSRYSAYALNLPDYIIKTTHSSNPQYSPDYEVWKESISYFSKETNFTGLIIHEFKEKGHEASVTFTANLSQNKRDASFTENSYFEKVGGGWYYSAGNNAKNLEELRANKFEWF